MLVRAAITEYNRLMFEEGRDSTEPRIDKHGRATAFFQEVNHHGRVDSNLFVANKLLKFLYPIRLLMVQERKL